MKKRWLSVTPEGEVTHLTFKKSKPNLAEMQAIVGGLIEPVRLPKRVIFWVNEDGIGLGLQYNMLASIHAGQALFGTALVEFYGN